MQDTFSPRDIALADDRVTVLASDRRDQLHLYAIGADNSLRWKTVLPIVGGQTVTPDLLRNAFYTVDATGRMTLFDDQTLDQLWVREGIALDKVKPPFAAGGMIVANRNHIPGHPFERWIGRLERDHEWSVV